MWISSLTFKSIVYNGAILIENRAYCFLMKYDLLTIVHISSARITATYFANAASTSLTENILHMQIHMHAVVTDWTVTDSRWQCQQPLQSAIVWLHYFVWFIIICLFQKSFNNLNILSLSLIKKVRVVRVQYVFASNSSWIITFLHNYYVVYSYMWYFMWGYKIVAFSFEKEISILFLTIFLWFYFYFCFHCLLIYYMSMLLSLI